MGKAFVVKKRQYKSGLFFAIIKELKMIELPPISPSYPIKKTDKIIRERKQQSGSDHAKDEKEQHQELDSNEFPDQHIDEYI